LTNDNQIKGIAVIGAGLMGHGIAQEFALAGFPVRLHDQTDELLGRALDNIRTNLKRLAALQRAEPPKIEPVLGAITASTRLDLVATGVDFVIEAISENIDAKHVLFRELEEVCPEQTIFASNTSSFMPSRLAEVLKYPERLLVAHYFNPPYLVPLVEIVPGPATAEATIATVIHLLEQVGKKPVLLRREATGFVANRLQFALYREALAIVEQGIADPKAVDQVVKFGFGRRLAAAGPFEVFDLAGLDTVLAIAGQIFPELPSAGSDGALVPEILRRRVEQGDLGVKSGRGFHDWPPEKAEGLRHRLAEALLRAESSR
jgi:3-hydroxybutyryl-CoA dehydrogenase